MKSTEVISCFRRVKHSGAICIRLFIISKEERFLQMFALSICKVIDVILNPVIGVFILVEIYLLIKILFEFMTLRRRVKHLNDNTKSEKTGTRRGHQMKETTYTVNTNLDWSEYDDICKKYQDNIKFHTGYLMIIQLLPLLGILGTVAGLFIALNTNAEWINAEGMYSGVKLALSSTVYGLIGAIISKFCDIFVSSLLIDYIDNGIDRFKDNYMEDREDRNLEN